MASDEGIEFPIELKDGVTAPANAEIRALRALTAEILETNKAMLELQKAAAKPIEPPKSKGFGDLAADIFKGVGALELAHKAFEGLKAGIVDGTEFVVGAAEFKENTIAAYAAVKGSAEEGERTFAAVDEMAHVVHFPARQAHDLAKELMLQGVEDTKLITAAVAASSSLIKEGQEAGAAKLKNIIEKSAASGHFDLKIGGGKGKAESGKALAGLGVSLPELLDSLAHRTGKSVATVKAQLKAGQIDVETGTSALVEAVNNSAIGKAGRAKFGLDEFKADVVNTFTSIAQDVDLTPLNQALVDADVALGSIASKDGPIREVFDAVVKGAAIGVEALTIFGLDLEIFGLEVELATTSLTKDFKGAFEGVGPVIEEAGAFLGKFAKIIGIEVVSIIEVLVKQVEALGAALGFAIDVVSTREIGRPWKALKATIGEIEGGLGKDLGRQSDVIGAIVSGKDIGEGLAQGVEHTAGRVSDATAGVVAGGIKSAREAADAHSPSQETMDLGRDMGNGLVIGFDSASVAASIGAGVAASTVAARGASVPAPAANGGGHSFEWHGDLYIGGQASNDEHLRSIVESAMADAFDRFALELGQ